MVAQWTDFGLGVVIDKNEFKFKPQVSEEEGMSFEAFKAQIRIKTDCERFGEVLQEIWKDHKSKGKGEKPAIGRHF